MLRVSSFRVGGLRPHPGMTVGEGRPLFLMPGGGQDQIGDLSWMRHQR